MTVHVQYDAWQVCDVVCEMKLRDCHSVCVCLELNTWRLCTVELHLIMLKCAVSCLEKQVNVGTCLLDAVYIYIYTKLMVTLTYRMSG